MAVQTRIQVRRGTLAQWVASAQTLGNGILYQGEIGYETDTGRFKIGDGSTAWSSLSYSNVLPSNFIAGSGISLTPGTNGSTLTISLSDPTIQVGDITDFNEGVDDRVAALLQAGTNISLNYNDNANTLTINSSLGLEEVQDAIGTYVVAGSGISVSYDDPSGYTTVSLSDPTIQLADVTDLSTNARNFLLTPSSTNLRTLVSDETGSGLLVFNTSPQFTTDINTNSTTFNVFNTTATTVNAFGAASGLNIGASTGTTTIKNRLFVQGNTNGISFQIINQDSDEIFTIDADGAITTYGSIYASSGNFTGSINANNFTLANGSVLNLEANSLTMEGNNNNQVQISPNVAKFGSSAIELNWENDGGGSPSDANGGGMIIRSVDNTGGMLITVDKSFTWASGTSAWTSSEHLNLAAGKNYLINGVQISASNLSNGVTGSGSIVLVNNPTMSGVTVNGNLTVSGSGLVASNINNFDSQVRTSRLDQMGAPTASVSLNNQKITNLATPTADNDAATKAYVDAIKQGLDVKDSVIVATTTNITLSGIQTIDDILLAENDRVLVKNQSDNTQNGIYIVSSGTWSRSSDANTFGPGGKISAGMFTFVSRGTTNEDTGWVLISNDVIVANTTPISFTQFSGAGQITAGAGMVKSGNTLDVGTASSSRIVVNADNIDLATVSQSNSSGSTGVNFVQSVSVDSYGRVTGATTADVRDATTSVKGIASFDSGDFSVTSGSVSIKSGGVDNSQLANSSVTVGSTSISLGGTSTTLAGLSSVTSSSFVGSLTGNASTATTLQNAWTINGTSFDGSANITIAFVDGGTP